MIIEEEDYLAHYGILRKSGRYPWGSGETQNIRNKTFLDYVGDLKREGMSEVEIARGVGMSTTQLRALRSIAKNEQKAAKQAMVQRLASKGYSNVAIGERMGLNESSVRALRSDAEKFDGDVLQTTASMLRDKVKEHKYVDVGTGVESSLGISATKLSTAVAILKEEGYEVHPVNIRQIGTGLDTKTKVLVPAGVTQKEVWQNKDLIRIPSSFSNDGGESYSVIRPPLSIHPNRVAVRYGDEGGTQTDGVIYVRPGVKDVSLGKARYAQVRVAVGDSHYLKGMAMYKDDLPDGVDVLFNTNKTSTGNKLDAMKALTDDPSNTFIASIRRQITERDSDGNDHVTSSMNLVNEEGSWNDWSRTIASQVLSKQSPRLVRTQLDMTFEDRKMEFDEISKLTNPTVRKKLLQDFSDSADSAAVHLQAARLPRMGWHVILPIDSIPPTQIYAPNFKDGERVVLIRYPHGGTFEIPELVVNNNHPESKRLLGSSPADAVGIHHTVAERLSGADFDGDTVLVIPNNSNRIKTSPALDGLKDFNPRTAYPGYEGMKPMSARKKGIEMGAISNLITDMTIRAANPTDVAAAVRHSMVVIDAEKHGLNYKQSAIDNGILRLKEKYQGGKRAGASTLISRAGAEVRVPDRKARTASKGGPINPVTGQREFEPRNTVNFKTGQPKLVKSKRLAEATDAHTLSSGTPIEQLYADHSNRLKSMANQARLLLIRTPDLKYSASARKVYAKEVVSLNAKLALAIQNRPLERQAQIIANATAKAKRIANPNMEPSTVKKMEFRALEEARNRTGAKRLMIKIEPEEWNAIQAGAISNSKLSQILDKADMENVRTLATPRQVLLMTPAKTARAKAMLDGDYTRAEVASALGVSLTTLDTATT